MFQERQDRPATRIIGLEILFRFARKPLTLQDKASKMHHHIVNFLGIGMYIPVDTALAVSDQPDFPAGAVVNGRARSRILQQRHLILLGHTVPLHPEGRCQLPGRLFHRQISLKVGNFPAKDFHTDFSRGFPGEKLVAFGRNTVNYGSIMLTEYIPILTGGFTFLSLQKCLDQPHVNHFSFVKIGFAIFFCLIIS